MNDAWARSNKVYGPPQPVTTIELQRYSVVLSERKGPWKCKMNHTCSRGKKLHYGNHWGHILPPHEISIDIKWCQSPREKEWHRQWKDDEVLGGVDDHHERDVRQTSTCEGTLGYHHTKGHSTRKGRDAHLEEHHWEMDRYYPWVSQSWLRQEQGPSYF